MADIVNQRGEVFYSGKGDFRASLEEAVREGIVLRGVDLRGKNLWGAQLQGAIMDIALVDRSTDLGNADLSLAEITYADFSGAYMGGCNLAGASASCCTFVDTDLQGARFARANVQSSNFHRADLFCSNFVNAYCHGAQFDDANVEAADFQDAWHPNLEKAKNPELVRPGRTREGLMLLLPGAESPMSDWEREKLLFEQWKLGLPGYKSKPLGGATHDPLDDGLPDAGVNGAGPVVVEEHLRTTPSGGKAPVRRHTRKRPQ